MAESSMLRRTFRNIATIAGLIEKNHPGQEKSGRQMTMNADLIYDVLRKHEPDHVLLRATRQEAAGGLTDVARIGLVLARARGRIRHMRLDRVSPLAVPALIEEGREWVAGGAEDALLAEAAALVDEATGGEEVFAETLAAGDGRRAGPRRRGGPAAPCREAGASRARPHLAAPCRRSTHRRDDRAAPIHMAGERLMLDPAGVLFWPSRRLLCGRDLHLEKGSHFAAAGGRFVPPYDTRETLARLPPRPPRWRPARLVLLGDSFHDRRGALRLGARGRGDAAPAAGRHRDGLGARQPRPGAAAGRARHLRGGMAGRRLHLPPPGRCPARWPASRCPGISIPRRRCRRAAAASPGRASSPMRSRLMMPAFGAYTGGLDAGDPAISALFPRGARLFLLGRERLFSMPARRRAAAAAPSAGFGGEGTGLPPTRGG